MSADSKHPLYAKGYARGRAKTVREVQATVQRQRYAEKWNAVFIQLLPTALTVQNWTFDNAPVNSTDTRLALCCAWTNHAVAKMK